MYAFCSTKNYKYGYSKEKTSHHVQQMFLGLLILNHHLNHTLKFWHSCGNLSLASLKKVISCNSSFQCQSYDQPKSAHQTFKILGDDSGIMLNNCHKPPDSRVIFSPLLRRVSNSLISLQDVNGSHHVRLTSTQTHSVVTWNPLNTHLENPN